MRLAFDCRGERWSLACDPAHAPRTLRALTSVLPLSLQLHTPKIAGSHIYWHAPFVEDAEGPVAVMAVPPGAFIYWPGRQFLELTFAPLQAETASVTVLGVIEDGLDRLAALGAALREGHGGALFEGRLDALDGLADAAPRPDTDALPPGLVSRRRALWAACPADVLAMLGSRAIMHPAGPVFMAESEARVLHEILWWVRARLGRDPAERLRYAAALATDKAATRLRDFCHLDASAALLFDLEAAFGTEAIPLAPLLDEAILIAGRLAAWIDLWIPWSPINEAMRRVSDAAAGHHPNGDRR